MRSCGRSETAVSHPLNPKTIHVRVWYAGSILRLPGRLIADGYLRTSHMAQPARKTPPMNMAKQYRP
jgi:hypothetical protein